MWCHGTCGGVCVPYASACYSGDERTCPTVLRRRDTAVGAPCVVEWDAVPVPIGSYVGSHTNRTLCLSSTHTYVRCGHAVSVGCRVHRVRRPARREDLCHARTQPSTMKQHAVRSALASPTCKPLRV